MKTFFTLILFFFGWHTSAQDYDIYVSDAGNFNVGPWQILKFDSSGQNGSVFIDTLLNWPQDILFMEDSSSVLISNLSSNSIKKYNATTGGYIADFTTAVSGPTRMKIGPDSLLYVLQWSGNGFVKRFELDGTFYDDFTSVEVTQSIGLDWDSDGNLYVSSYDGDHVRKFDPEGEDLGLFVDSDLLGPTNIWFDEEGDLLVVDYNSTAVRRFDSEGNYVSDFMTGLLYAEGVQCLPNGDILIGNGNTSSVKRYSGEGLYLEEFVESGSEDLITPNAVVLRYHNSLGINEVKKVEQKIVYPSIGSHFSFYSQLIPNIESIHIYSIGGKQQLASSISPHSRLDLSMLSDGMYFLKVQFVNGEWGSQKIIVQSK